MDNLHAKENMKAYYIFINQRNISAFERESKTVWTVPIKQNGSQGRGKKRKIYFLSMEGKGYY